MTPELLNSIVLAKVPGVVHGFSTRQGGVSQAPFASLNLGGWVSDDKERVITNRQRVLAGLGAPEHGWTSLKQVHGDVVHEVTRLAGRSVEGDGLWTRDNRAAVAVMVADCVPVLMAPKKGGAVAAVHAGWRGTKARIVARMTERFVGAGFPAKELVAAIGPAIGPCCFEIGDDVAIELRQAFPDASALIRPKEGGKWTADLWGLNREALLVAGLLAENIDEIRQCTVCTPNKFFSHRRDEGNTGRQCGVIALVG